MHAKVVRRAKWSGLSFLALAAVTYFGTSLSDRMDNYISFVDAQEELLLEQFPEGDLDERG